LEGRKAIPACRIDVNNEAFILLGTDSIRDFAHHQLAKRIEHEDHKRARGNVPRKRVGLDYLRERTIRARNSCQLARNLDANDATEPSFMRQNQRAPLSAADVHKGKVFRIYREARHRKREHFRFSRLVAHCVLSLFRADSQKPWGDYAAGISIPFGIKSCARSGVGNSPAKVGENPW
jgi:hypothetical protein